MPFSRFACAASAVLLYAAATPLGVAQGLPKTDIPIERLYQYPVINGRSPAGAALSPDGSKVVFGWNKTGARKLDLWALDFPNGKPHLIIEANKIQDLPRQEDTRTELEKKEQALYDGGLGGAQWSPDSREILFQYKGRIWLANPDGTNLHPLVDGQVAIYSPTYSPDGKFISYSNGQNLFRLDRKTGAVKQLTFISKANTVIESANWSPDGKQIFVTWADNSKTGRHVMMDFSKDRATVVNISRGWNGDLDQNVQFGLIPSDGGIIRWVPEIPSYLWVKDLEWSPDSTKIAISWISDDDQKYNLTVIPATTLKRANIYTETAPKNFINDWRPMTWARDSKSLFFGTDLFDGKFGFRGIMRVDFDGKNLRSVYRENHDVGSFIRPKESDRLILATATPTPLQAEIKIIEPDGKIKTHSVFPGGYSVPKEFNWAGSPLVSDDGKAIATLASGRTRNAELYAVEPKLERLTTSQLPEFNKIEWADIKEVEIPGPEGATLHGLLYTKKGLDLTKKHPAFISSIYGDSGKASWAGYLENFAATHLDMVVLQLDFRSSWGYGGEFNSGYYRKLGLIDADEAVSARDYLANLSYVRPDRVGIWGWSYGGFLTCMTLETKPGKFYAGVAVASVTNWKSYNEWYTRRRLGLVKDDKDKYFEKTSPVTYAGGLQDNLLLVHGILDDNVLFQDTEQLIQQFIDHGKYVDVMTYPRDDHSIGKDTSRPHVFATIMRYLYNKLSTP